MIKSNGGIIGPDNVTTGGAFGSASGVFKLGEVTNLIKDSKWPTAGPQGFQVANSCRFNDGSSDYLNRSLSSTSTSWTFSAWVKRGSNLGATNYIISWGNSGTDATGIGFNASNTFQYYSESSPDNKHRQTSAVYRDTSAWYHLVVKSNSNAITLYVNGEEPTQSWTTGSSANPLDTSTMQIGKWVTSAYYHDGYMAEVCFIDGTALDATSFGEFNSQTGIWVPKVVTGLTFGTNGFYLPFTNASALGEDFSGEDNDFTVNNLTSIDQSTDTCSTNFATMNPLSNYYNSDAAFSDGNNTVECGGTGSAAITSTIGASSGKWYAEFKNVTGSGGGSVFGIESLSYQTGTTHYVGYNDYSWGYFQQDGKIKNNNSDIATYSSQTNGDICGIALDLDNNKLYFSKNGTWQNSADPSAGTGGISITAPASTDTGVYLFSGSDDNQYASRTFSSDFGSPVYAISSGNTDGNGFGNFEYAVPTGFLSLNTKNLAAVLA